MDLVNKPNSKSVLKATFVENSTVYKNPSNENINSKKYCTHSHNYSNNTDINTKKNEDISLKIDKSVIKKDRKNENYNDEQKNSIQNL